MNRIAIIVGTRPEAIKLLPLYKALKESESIEPVLVASGQHLEMISSLWDIFEETPDYVMNSMAGSGGLAALTANLFTELSGVVDSIDVQGIVVQGDTTTAMVGAMVGFYEKIPVCHIEAGLRTYDKHSPFPEEVNRQIISRVADLHFAPTSASGENLINEHIDNSSVFIVGNTVLDAVRLIREKVESSMPEYSARFSDVVSSYEKLVLITGHRRENIGEKMDEILSTIHTIAASNPGIGFVFPVHLNPAVKSSVEKHLSGVENIHLLKPLPYDELIFFMMQASLIITDSGGIQEEAPSFGIPTIITRDSTERDEGIKAGFNYLAGTDGKALKQLFETLIAEDRGKYEGRVNPYGDGWSSQKIASIIEDRLNEE